MLLIRADHAHHAAAAHDLALVTDSFHRRSDFHSFSHFALGPTPAPASPRSFARAAISRHRGAQSRPSGRFESRIRTTHPATIESQPQSVPAPDPSATTRAGPDRRSTPARSCVPVHPGCARLPVAARRSRRDIAHRAATPAPHLPSISTAVRSRVDPSRAFPQLPPFRLRLTLRRTSRSLGEGWRADAPSTPLTPERSGVSARADRSW